MKHNTTHETLLARWIEGSLTTEETRILAEMEGIEELKEMLTSLEEVELPPMNMDAAWDKLAQKTIHAPKVSQTKRKNLRPMYFRIAAVAVLLVGIGFWYSVNIRPQEYFANVGTVEEVVLPDGSMVTLNAGSKLKYSKWDWKHNRTINLTGEAFFKVAKGEQFTVKTVHGETKVLGTQFDVYDRGATFEVKCFEGRVQVSGYNQASIISKGQGVKITKNTMKQLQVAGNNPTWMNGQSKFFENSLQEVFDEMERQYILDIDSEGINLNQQFTGVLPNKDLKKALAIITSTMNLTYEISNDNKQIKISSK